MPRRIPGDAAFKFVGVVAGVVVCGAKFRKHYLKMLLIRLRWCLCEGVLICIFIYKRGFGSGIALFVCGILSGLLKRKHILAK